MLCEYDHNPRTKEYLSNCKEKIQGYEEILTDLKQVPSLLQKIHEKMKQICQIYNCQSKPMQEKILKFLITFPFIFLNDPLMIKLPLKYSNC